MHIKQRHTNLKKNAQRLSIICFSLWRKLKFRNNIVNLYMTFSKDETGETEPVLGLISLFKNFTITNSSILHVLPYS